MSDEGTPFSFDAASAQHADTGDGTYHHSSKRQSVNPFEEDFDSAANSIAVCIAPCYRLALVTKPGKLS